MTAAKLLAAFLLLVAAPLFSSASADAAEPALTCEGSGHGPQRRPYSFKIRLQDRNDGQVSVLNPATGAQCTCTYALDNVFDLWVHGHVRNMKVNLRWQRCESGCGDEFKKLIKSSIQVTQYRDRDERYAVPFVRSEIARCDVFAMDIERLRRMREQLQTEWDDARRKK